MDKDLVCQQEQAAATQSGDGIKATVREGVVVLAMVLLQRHCPADIGH
jgi:hypothetical protein